MNLRWVLALIAPCAVLGRSPAPAPAPTPISKSVYTSLDDKTCRILEEADTGEPYAALCPGFQGHVLKPIFLDAREELAVIDPAGVEFALGFTALIGHGFSALGSKAEWRVQSRGGAEVPTALIVRFNVQAPDTLRSYLAVSKIATGRICLVAAIPPGPDQNGKARAAADSASRMECLEDKR